jgi:hypothetical protein
LSDHQMPNRYLATLASLRVHTILMSFPRIPNPIEGVYWSICKFLELIEPKSTPKWPKNVQESKIQKEISSSRTSRSSIEKERGRN